jgi:hypothetical protein
MATRIAKLKTERARQFRFGRYNNFMFFGQKANALRPAALVQFL